MKYEVIKNISLARDWEVDICVLTKDCRFPIYLPYSEKVIEFFHLADSDSRNDVKNQEKLLEVNLNAKGISQNQLSQELATSVTNFLERKNDFFQPKQMCPVLFKETKSWKYN